MLSAHESTLVKVAHYVMLSVRDSTLAHYVMLSARDSALVNVASNVMLSARAKCAMLWVCDVA